MFVTFLSVVINRTELCCFFTILALFFILCVGSDLAAVSITDFLVIVLMTF